MSEKMSNAPLYYALAQARFNPVGAMAKYVDEVQDRLRRVGYTLFEPQQVTHLQIATAASQAPVEPQVAHTLSWLITKGDRTAGFILGASSITFHTTHYETRHEFIAELLRGLKAVHAVAELDHVNRLGLRYLDAVVPRANDRVADYLVGGLHGVEFGATPRYAMNESVFATASGPLLSSGTLVARVHWMNAPLGFPPDMVPNGLVLMPRFASNQVRDHAVIDIDHFVEGTMALDFPAIQEQLTSLQATIRQAFEATITEHARRIWV